jgi:hypothetical protein
MSNDYHDSLSETAAAMGRASNLLLGMPFDLARAQYTQGVRSGLIERSLLGWANFERTVSALEQLILGPWARRV